MNVINSVTDSVHLDWHAAGEPTNFEQAYSRNGFHFLVRVNRADGADGPWTTTVFGVSRHPSTDVVNFKQPLYDCVLEQTSECAPHPRQAEADSPENGSENGPENELDHRSNLGLLDQAIQQVMYAVIDVGSYDDESETLIYHTQQLESAQEAITQVRKNLSNNTNA